MICFCDVKLCTCYESNMEDNAEMLSGKKSGGRYCVAGALNKTSCKNNSHTDGIAMHQFPENPEVRRKWVKFVQRHRSDFDESCVSNYTSLCSAHIDASCYTHSTSLQIEGMAKKKKFLTRGSIPTRDSFLPVDSNTLTERRKRQVRLTMNLMKIEYSTQVYIVCAIPFDCLVTSFRRKKQTTNSETKVLITRI